MSLSKNNSALRAAHEASRATDRAIERTMADWRLPRPDDPSLFSTPRIRPERAEVVRAFGDPNYTGTFGNELAKIDPVRRQGLTTSMGAAVALDAARSALAFENNLLGGIAQQLAGIQEAIRAPVLQMTSFVETVQNAALAARPYVTGFADMMVSFVEAQREADERTDAFVQRHGWPVPISLMPRRYGKIVSLVDAPKREVSTLMVELFRPGARGYYETREAIEDSKYFRSRRPLLTQVYRAQRRGDWYLVINGLLPLVEGVLLDAMFPTGSRPKSIKPGVEQLAKSEVDFGAGALRAVETMLTGVGAGSALFEPYDPPPGVEPRTLNRHAVLHGAARRYGTEQNAIKLYLLLVVMAESLMLKDIA